MSQSPVLISPKQHVSNLRTFLAKPSAQAAMAAVASKQFTPERLTKLCLLAASRQPELADCAPESFLMALMIAAQLRLDPSGLMGSAYLVPFRNRKRDGRKEVQLIVGYRGLIDLVSRTGRLKQIEARIVYENDQFDMRFGVEPRFDHVPKLDGDRGRAKLVYMIARLADGGTHIDWMTTEDVNRIRSRSKASDSGPWLTDWEEMAKKTVIRRGIKMLPMSIEDARDYAIGAALENADADEAADISGLLELPAAAEEAILEVEKESKVELVQNVIEAVGVVVEAVTGGDEKPSEAESKAAAVRARHAVSR